MGNRVCIVGFHAERRPGSRTPKNGDYVPDFVDGVAVAIIDQTTGMVVNARSLGGPDILSTDRRFRRDDGSHVRKAESYQSLYSSAIEWLCGPDTDFSPEYVGTTSDAQRFIDHWSPYITTPRWVTGISSIERWVDGGEVVARQEEYLQHTLLARLRGLPERGDPLIYRALLASYCRAAFRGGLCV